MSILDYPEAYGFDEDDIDEAQGSVWLVYSTKIWYAWADVICLGWIIYIQPAKSTVSSRNTCTNSLWISHDDIHKHILHR